MTYCQLNQNTNIFIQDNGFENVVWNESAILSLPQWVNSLRLSHEYMHQKTRPSLIQIMAWCLTGTKPLFEPMLEYTVNWTLGKNFQRNFNQNITVFIQENAFENVICKVSSLLSLPQRVTTLDIPLVSPRPSINKSRTPLKQHIWWVGVWPCGRFCVFCGFDLNFLWCWLLLRFDHRGGLRLWHLHAELVLKASLRSVVG